MLQSICFIIIFSFNLYNLRALARFCFMWVGAVGKNGKKHSLKIPWSFGEILITRYLSMRPDMVCISGLCLLLRSECSISHPFSSLVLSFKELSFSLNQWLEKIPSGSGGKESTCNMGDPGLIPGVGRSPGEWNGYPLQYSCRRIP